MEPEEYRRLLAEMADAVINAFTEAPFTDPPTGALTPLYRLRAQLREEPGGLMTVAVWKYPLDIGSVTLHDMPLGAKIIHVQGQNGAPALWALVPRDVPTLVRRRFIVVGTGTVLRGDAEALTYLGTAHCGELVWHVFEDQGK